MTTLWRTWISSRIQNHFTSTVTQHSFLIVLYQGINNVILTLTTTHLLLIFSGKRITFASWSGTRTLQSKVFFLPRGGVLAHREGSRSSFSDLRHKQWRRAQVLGQHMLQLLRANPVSVSISTQDTTQYIWLHLRRSGELFIVAFAGSLQNSKW